MQKFIVLCVLLIGVSLILTGCFPGGEHYAGKEPAGFFSGIWHGWIAPLSLIVGLFDHDIRIYEKNNTGWWYDFGYYIAVIAGFGGFALTRKNKKEDQV